MASAHGLSSSSEETVEVEESEESSSPDRYPEATAKSAALPLPDATRRTEARTGRGEESAHKTETRMGPPRDPSQESRPAKRGRSPGRRPAGTRGGAKRPRSPSVGPKGKGRDSKGENRVQCRYCHQLVGNNIAAMSQHQYWNWTCLRWQRYGRGMSWEEAATAASRQKQRRDERARREMGMPAKTYAPSKPSTPEAPRKKHRSEATHVKSEKHDKHDRKRKKEKRNRAPVASPSPEVYRGRGGKKNPPSSSDSEGHGPLRQHPRTLVIKLPQFGK